MAQAPLIAAGDHDRRSRMRCRLSEARTRSRQHQRMAQVVAAGQEPVRDRRRHQPDGRPLRTASAALTMPISRASSLRRARTSCAARISGISVNCTALCIMRNGEPTSAATHTVHRQIVNTHDRNEQQPLELQEDRAACVMPTSDSASRHSAATGRRSPHASLRGRPPGTRRRRARTRGRCQAAAERRCRPEPGNAWPGARRSPAPCWA